MLPYIDPNIKIVETDGRMAAIFQLFISQVANESLIVGSGTPEGVLEALQGRFYMDEDGAAGSVLYIKQKDNRVFDEIANAKAITAWFSKYMQLLEIETSNELGHIRSFHSFRHSYITKLMNTEGMNVNLLQQVVGHEISSFGITGNYTHKATDIKLLLNVVDAFVL